MNRNQELELLWRFQRWQQRMYGIHANLEAKQRNKKYQRDAKVFLDKTEDEWRLFFQGYNVEDAKDETTEG